MQKASLLKRAMTLFLAFVMAVGTIPFSELVSPAYAAEGKEGPPSTISMYDADFKNAYESKNLVPSKTIPRVFLFNVDGGISPGFCANHQKDVSMSDTWQSPVSLESTKYSIAIPLIAQYNYRWTLSREIDAEFGNSIPETEKDKIALERSNGDTDYWNERERMVGFSVPQAAIWLIGNDKVDDLSDPAQLRMVAEERIATVQAMNGKPPVETVDEVVRWLSGGIQAYHDGRYGKWETYLYQPKTSGMQPIVTTIPKSTSVEEKHGWIKIKKTDSSGRNLSGATFGVYRDASCTSKVTEFTTTGDEWTYVDVSRSMMDSTQTFYLKETSAPSGYVPSGKVYSVTVSSTNNSTKETAAAVNGGAAIKNSPPAPIHSNSVIQKVDAATGEGVGPATFHFEGQADDPATGQKGAVNADYTTDDAGALEIQWTDPSGENYLPAGQYTVTEKIAPPGYELDTEAQHLVLSLEWDAEAEEWIPSSSGPLVFQDDPKKIVTIKKVSEDGGLAGAYFDVYKNGQKLTSIGPTDESGTVIFEGEDGNGVSTGYYEFVETKAPDGYLIPWIDHQGIYVDASNHDIMNYELTFVNQEYAEIIIQKVDAGKEDRLAGAVFEVKIDGTDLGRVGPTGEDGTIVLDYATYGEFLDPEQESWTVQVREVQAPDGYLIDDPDWQTAEIRRGQTLAPFVFTDTKYPEIVIRKSDRETEERLPGTTFEISIDAGASFSLTKQTDENGEIWITYEDYEQFIGDIVWDKGWTVTVTETIMPDGYNKDKQEESGDWTITKQLQPGQSLLEFDFTDTHYRDLLVRKYDSNNSWLIPIL